MMGQTPGYVLSPLNFVGGANESSQTLTVTSHMATLFAPTLQVAVIIHRTGVGFLSNQCYTIDHLSLRTQIPRLPGGVGGQDAYLHS
jgi:hypothetical protein